VRPAAFAGSDTTLSERKSSTWSGVSFKGPGANCRNDAWSFASPERQRNQHALALDGRKDNFHDLAHGQHFRTAEFVGCALSGLAVDGGQRPRRRRCRHRPAATLSCRHRSRAAPGEILARPAKRLVNWSSGPNTTEGRMIVAEGTAESMAFFAGGLGRRA